MLRCVIWPNLADVSEVLTTFIKVMSEAVRIPETSVKFHHSARTLRNIPADSYLHIRRHEDLK